MSSASEPPDWRGDRAFWAAFSLLAALFLAPLWVAVALPMQDAPAHVAVVDALSHRGDEPGWDQHFTSRLGLRPYAGYYGLALALSRLLGPEPATRALLALLWLLRALGARSPWPALWGFALAYNDSYLVGFAGFLLGTPLVLAGLALTVGLATERYAPRRAVPGLALLSVGAYLLHPLALGLLLALSVLAALALRPPRRARVGLALALAPAALLCGLTALEGGARGVGATWLDAGTKLALLAGYPWLWLEGSSRSLLALALALALGSLFLALRDA